LNISELADATVPVEQRTANQREAGQLHNFCLHCARQISATKLRLFWDKNMFFNHQKWINLFIATI